MTQFDWSKAAEKQWDERADGWNARSREMWEAGSRKDITSGHVEQVRQLFFGEVGRRISLPRGITAERTYETVDLFFVWKEKEKEAALQPFCRMLAIPGETLCGNGMRFRVKVMDFDGNFEKIPEKARCCHHADGGDDCAFCADRPEYFLLFRPKGHYR